MLSDEEKKAIEYWKTHVEILHWNAQLASEHYIKVLLELIDKQSKEIEELKDIKQKICNEELLEQEYVKENFIYKDKIKAKIEEEDKLFFKTKDVRHANRYKAYKELLEKE